MDDRPQVSDYLHSIITEGPQLAQDTWELAKAELGKSAKVAGWGGGFAGVAVVFAAGALGLVIFAIAFALSLIFYMALQMNVVLSLCLGFIVMAIIALVIAAILAFLARNRLTKLEPPKSTIEEVKLSAQTLLDAARRGRGESSSALAQGRGGQMALEDPLERPSLRP